MKRGHETRDDHGCMITHRSSRAYNLTPQIVGPSIKDYFAIYFGVFCRLLPVPSAMWSETWVKMTTMLRLKFILRLLVQLGSAHFGSVWLGSALSLVQNSKSAYNLARIF